MLSTDRQTLRRTEQQLEQGTATGSTDQLQRVEQVPFPEATATPGEWSSEPQYEFPEAGAAGGRVTDPGVFSDEIAQLTTPTTGQSADVSVGSLVPQGQENAQPASMPGQYLPAPVTPMPPAAATSARKPLVIKGARSKGAMSPGAIPKAPRKRSVFVHVAIVAILTVILGGTLASFASVDRNGQAQGVGKLFQPLINLVASRGNEASDVLSQVATPTATAEPTPTPTPEPLPEEEPVIPGPSNSGGTSSAPDSGHLNRFSYGYCTYWANMRYHEMTGHWVPWLGDAYMWAYQASSYGWVVSDVPTVPSIIVLQPHVYTSGPLGHVAVVESINPDGSANTSNWNWIKGWEQYEMVNFKPGPGVKFLSYPG